MSIHCKETQYGFEYGSAEVTRLCSDNKRGWVIICLETPRHLLNHGIQLYVTKTGKVRIYDERGEWSQPEGK